MNEVVHTSPTIGSNVEEIVVKNTHFLMWDIGGQESLRSSWNTYYSNTEVRNTSNTMGAHFVHFERRYCPAAGFFPERGSWCVCSAHQTAAGAAPSQRSGFHKGARLTSKARVSLRSVLEKKNRRVMAEADVWRILKRAL